MFEDEGGCFGLGVADDVEELDYVCSAAHVLKDFDFTLDLFFLDGFEDFDYAFCVGSDVCAFEYLWWLG